ncbi:MAG: ion transporter [Proteobacteria bacterium]|nr:ion transporter [Pseudomonadota bacterium]MBT4106365.1 ion transporter [Pseudomonadota bacterium]MBT4986165.1 ion transporter [Pseudomonadota bacterium]MBT5188357.1 ion transporter [Pseudomonadota bacterium]MBT6071411.1 ion transporter [Pseudomonadota bacterium]
MTSLKQIVEETDTRMGKIFDLTIQILIVASAVSFAIETLPGLSSTTARLLAISEALIIGLFTVEYLLRFYSSQKKLSFVFSFYGLIDLAAVLPFYLAVGLDLRSLRIFRLARLAILLKLFRFSKAARRFQLAFKLVREEILVFGLFSLALIYLSAVGIYHFEHEAQPEVFVSVFDGIWWATVTLTTVGYGDVVPITTGGKVFTFFVFIVGLSMIAVPSGLVASALSKVRELEK